MAAATPLTAVFDPARFERFRFVACELDTRGQVRLRYALDDEIDFVEEYDLPIASPLGRAELQRVENLLALLHWVAGVSYFKTAAPPTVSCENGIPSPAVAELLAALYSEGLGEFAYTNHLQALPRPAFPTTGAPSRPGRPAIEAEGRVLVPIGGGKDSVVALETVRRAGREPTLFSVESTGPIGRTAAVAALPHLVARRRLDPNLAALNAGGALNGHVPVTAIVACVAVLTAALREFDVVAMANERSASRGSVHWDGTDVNHQFSKGLRAERLFSAALSELGAETRLFSILRPASELAIARAFAGMERYHRAFTSCNALFRSDPRRRASSWCCHCPKCRFVFLMLAPFSSPAHLHDVFGRDLLDEDRQYDGFAELTGVTGRKPFECVGEEEETLAAIRLLVDDLRWSGHRVVRRLAAEILPQVPPTAGSPSAMFELGEDHAVPAAFMPHLRAVLGA